MKTFFDSSAFAKRYIQEPGSAAVEDLCQGSQRLALCVLCVPEILSALNRKVREKSLTLAHYLMIKEQLLADIRDAEIVNLTEEVVAYSAMALEQNPLRAMDALHVAAAKAWGAELFVTADKVQGRAAHRIGLKPQLI